MSDSENGTLELLPYTEELEAKIILITLYFLIVSSNETVPVTLMSKKRNGSSIEGLTPGIAAKWITRQGLFLSNRISNSPLFLFNHRIVEIVEIINADYVIPAFKKEFTKMGPYKSGPACDNYGISFNQCRPFLIIRFARRISFVSYQFFCFQFLISIILQSCDNAQGGCQNSNQVKCETDCNCRFLIKKEIVGY